MRPSEDTTWKVVIGVVVALLSVGAATLVVGLMGLTRGDGFLAGGLRENAPDIAFFSLLILLTVGIQAWWSERRARRARD